MSKKHFIVYEVWDLEIDEPIYVHRTEVKRPSNMGVSVLRWKRHAEKCGLHFRVAHRTDCAAEAYLYENMLIRQYGRRDIGDGPLLNTDCGLICHTPDVNRKWTDDRRGNVPWYSGHLVPFSKG